MDYDMSDTWDAYMLRNSGYSTQTLAEFVEDGIAIYSDTPAGYGWTIAKYPGRVGDLDFPENAFFVPDSDNGLKAPNRVCVRRQGTHQRSWGSFDMEIEYILVRAML